MDDDKGTPVTEQSIATFIIGYCVIGPLFTLFVYAIMKCVGAL